MALSHSPSVITNGIVLYLDAANTKSYPGSGTTWNDISNNKNNGILTNSPTFSSSNNGFFTFNGSTQFVDSGTNNNLLPTAGLTICSWVKTSVADKFIVDKMDSGLTAGFAMMGTSLSKFQMRIGAIESSSLSNITTNTWLFLTGVWTPSTSIKNYINGVYETQNTTSIPASIADPSVNFWIAKRRTGVDLWNGNIASVQIYNRALTDTEISQNFAATRGRFGI